MSPRAARTTAERVSLVGSAAVLLVVVALIAWQIPGDGDPAAPFAQVGATRVVGDTFHVDVTVGNSGDAAAEHVHVTAELVVDGDEYVGDQTVDLVSAGDKADLTFVFADDPAAGELSVRVTGFAVP